MQKREMLYEGKAKKVFATDDPKLYCIQYKDDATAFDGMKKGSILGKGAINNKLTAHLFKMFESNGVPTHFVELVGDREMIVKALKIVKLEVVMRNIVAGSLSKRLGIEEGARLKKPVLEFYYKSDELHDPLINEYHIAALEVATPEQLDIIKGLAFKVNDIMIGYLAKHNITLVDFKLEFGLYDDQIVLGDEMSPDTCRFWDAASGEKLDKDRFRRDLGGVEEAYQEVYRRLIG